MLRFNEFSILFLESSPILALKHPSFVLPGVLFRSLVKPVLKYCIGKLFTILIFPGTWKAIEDDSCILIIWSFPEAKSD